MIPNGINTINQPTFRQFQISNSCGTTLEVCNLGAAITALRIADRSGKFQDVVLGFDRPEDYLNNPFYFGVVVGRFANRIAGGKFNIGSQQYQLARNGDKNHIHGGSEGFHSKLWSVANSNSSQPNNEITLELLSPDGEENYPGNLKTSVTYSLTDDNALVIDYRATTDKPTIINLTQHSYFNLAGHDSGNILNHELQVLSSQFTPVDSDQIPTGEIADVTDSPMDLRKLTRIGDILNQENRQLERSHGLDHNYVLKHSFDDEVKIVAVVRDQKTGRCMQVLSDQPGVQIYTGNFIADGTPGKEGATYNCRQGLCLETQHFPNSPNQPNFPSVVLEPGKCFSSRTVYQFSI